MVVQNRKSGFLCYNRQEILHKLMQLLLGFVWLEGWKSRGIENGLVRG